MIDSLENNSHQNTNNSAHNKGHFFLAGNLTFGKILCVTISVWFCSKSLSTFLSRFCTNCIVDKFRLRRSDRPTRKSIITIIDNFLMMTNVISIHFNWSHRQFSNKIFYSKSLCSYMVVAHYVRHKSWRYESYVAHPRKISKIS